MRPQGREIEPGSAIIINPTRDRDAIAGALLAALRHATRGSSPRTAETQQRLTRGTTWCAGREDPPDQLDGAVAIRRQLQVKEATPRYARHS
ncbi:MAG: hypothetical protein IPM12_14905 [Flavobacteriales bacterium]|nr:hypothetical protein [Flavobacteriales bacterium]